MREGYARTGAPSDLLAGARRLRGEGARRVVVTRAAGPVIVAGDGDGDGDGLGELGLRGPAFESLDARGSGDSMFAAVGVGLPRGLGMLDALRLGMAAGALNTTRRGLGSGTREEIERLAAHVSPIPLAALDCDGS